MRDATDFSSFLLNFSFGAEKDQRLMTNKKALH